MMMTLLLTFQIFWLCFSTALSISSHPKVWLSEYGSTIYKPGNSLEQVTTSAAVSFQHNEILRKGFMLKKYSSYVAEGNITQVAFTCEAEQPVFWSISQEVKMHHKITAPSWNIITLDLRGGSDSSDPNTTTKATFKSIIYIDTAVQSRGYLDLLIDRFQKRHHTNQTWTLTCHTANTTSGTSTSITLRVGNPEPNYGTPTHSPDEKITIAILKPDNQSASLDDSQKTVLYLDDALFTISTSATSNKRKVAVGWNSVLNISESNSNLTLIGVDGLEHFNYLQQSKGGGSPTNLVEYEEDEPIFEGDTIQIFCYSLHAFYSFSGYVQINWTNGSSVILEDVDTERKGIQVWLNSDWIDNHPLFGKYNISNLVHEELIFYLTQSFEVKLDMKSVDCLMPLWRRDGKWEHVTKQLNIIPKPTDP